LGINDKDCNVAMPSEVYESPYFIANRTADPSDPICYSTYQRELNNLYFIASAVIETIFGIRSVGSAKQVAAAQITKVTAQLWSWRTSLPAHLSLDLDRDCGPCPSAASRVHHLQALSLQLTFDNLLIIIHRPFLAQHVDDLLNNQPDDGLSVNQTGSDFASAPHEDQIEQRSQEPEVSSTEQWWNAALRTSRVTEMPQLAQLATDSHLVAFLAINLFNSAIVMIVVALSDPLSDRTLEVKRTVTRIVRLQEILGKRSTLPLQNNVVLKDVIRMLLQREADAMLAPVRSTKKRKTRDAADISTPSSDAASITVEDTLRLPLQLPLNSSGEFPQQRTHTEMDSNLRLNESLASVQKGIIPRPFHSTTRRRC
jgi:hypothetical protein